MASLGVFSILFILIPTNPLPTSTILIWLASSAVASAVAFFIFRVYRIIIRYSTLREVGRIGIAVLGKELLLWIAMVCLSDFSATSGLLAGMVAIDFLISTFFLLAARVCMIVIYDYLRRASNKKRSTKRILIYGISDKAVAAVSRLRNSPHYTNIGFLCYGKEASGYQLMGQPVYHFDNAEDVARLAAEIDDLEGILFPYINDARREQDRLIGFCRAAHLRTYIMPGVDEMTDANFIGNYVRKIKIEDLLGREEIKISMDEITTYFTGKVVMVTGAAGSIGSELCRQIARLGVKKLVLFDNAETPLHNIRLELEDKYPELDFTPVIGDVRSKERLDDVFRLYRPQVVYHAAAYKHVPLMEENPCEAVLVNVTGTRQVADKCVEYGVERMVMISTDKAVNPTNIMGCTKRMAEIYVQSLGLAIEKGEKEGKTRFVTTRFGNVLGSNGSVIPRFQEQIEHGGPVTVTHPDINRFFMTIPEACRLVMEAATFASGTQIFVFDMGQPVKIVDLARKMIELAGMEPGKDIKIEFTGLRPGEKLYEEVLATKENTIPTQHKRIFVAKAREYGYSAACEATEHLHELATRVTIPEMVSLMKCTVPEFKSQHSEFEKYDTPAANK